MTQMKSGLRLSVALLAAALVTGCEASNESAPVSEAVQPQAEVDNSQQQTRLAAARAAFSDVAIQQSACRLTLLALKTEDASAGCQGSIDGDQFVITVESLGSMTFRYADIGDSFDANPDQGLGTLKPSDTPGHYRNFSAGLIFAGSDTPICPVVSYRAPASNADSVFMATQSMSDLVNTALPQRGGNVRDLVFNDEAREPLSVMVIAPREFFAEVGTIRVESCP